MGRTQTDKTGRDYMVQPLWAKDYLEIMDMDNSELSKYTKEDLIKLIGQLTEELHHSETQE